MKVKLRWKHKAKLDFRFNSSSPKSDLNFISNLKCKLFLKCKFLCEISVSVRIFLEMLLYII